jgi:hypothetical protein
MLVPFDLRDERTIQLHTVEGEHGGMSGEKRPMPESSSAMVFPIAFRARDYASTKRRSWMVALSVN